MPLLGFKKFLVPMILQGNPWWKLGTIRALRKNPFKKWDVLYMYTGLRTKNCEYLGVSLCTSEYTFTMHLDRSYPCISTYVGNERAYWEKREIEELAITDGFTSAAEMWEWFRKTHGEKQEIFQRIEWKIPPLKIRRCLSTEQMKIVLNVLNNRTPPPFGLDAFQERMKHLLHSKEGGWQ